MYKRQEFTDLYRSFKPEQNVERFVDDIAARVLRGDNLSEVKNYFIGQQIATHKKAAVTQIEKETANRMEELKAQEELYLVEV